MKQLNIYKKLKDSKSYNRAQIKEFSYLVVDEEWNTDDWWYNGCYDDDWYDGTSLDDEFKHSKLYRATGFMGTWEEYREQYQTVV